MPPSLAETLPWIAASAALVLALVFRRPRTALLAYDLALGLLWPHPPSPALFPVLALVALLVPEARMNRFSAMLLFALPWLLAWAEEGVLAVAGGTTSAVLAHLSWLLALGQWVQKGEPLRFAQTLALLVAAWALAPLGGAPLALNLSAGIASALLFGGVVLTSYRLAFHDPLTGLGNRRALEEALASLAAPCAVAMVDVDHFKRINDRHGHAAGDQVLIGIARRLRRVPGASAYRYGGEEFCLIFTKRAAAGAEPALEALRRRIGRERLSVSGKGGARELRVTVSIGLAIAEGGPLDAWALRAKADEALYRAKEAGRNRLMRA